jgi:hypothetical protein
MAEVPRPDEPVSGGLALIRSVYRSGLRDLIAEGLDILLDSALEEGVLRDIPIGGWMFKTVDVITSVRERLYLGKILRFLQGMEGVTDEERDAFAARMEADRDYARRVRESVLLLLDRHETADKSELLGRVFKAFMRREISDEEFHRYAFIIDRLFLQDLLHLECHYARVIAYEAARQRGNPGDFNQYLDEQATQALFGYGLLDSGGFVETAYHRNDRGEKLIRLIGSP